MEQRKPDWLRIKSYSGTSRSDVEEILKRLSLHTVCEEANCPNMGECFSRSTATFMILGNFCTRDCTFCNVQKNEPQAVDPTEPIRVAKAVRELNLKHIVITSVTRDDLPDGGAGHFAKVIESIKELDKNVVVEVLIPDFQGSLEALSKVAEAKPEIINHNVETVPHLYSEVRPMAVYARSLELLRNVKALDGNIYSKSGIMVGLGETEHEVLDVFRDLRDVGCDFLTIGQYLAPSKKHHPVVEYIHPDLFQRYKEQALNIGFKYVASGPLVRSSYLADKALGKI